MAKNKAKEVAYEERLGRVAALLRARMSYREIATAIPCGLATVKRDVDELLRRFREEQLQATGDRVMVVLGCLGDAMRAITNDVRSGDLASIDQYRKLLAEECKIYGLYAPAKVAPTDPTGAAAFQPKTTYDLTDEQLMALIVAKGAPNDGAVNG